MFSLFVLFCVEKCFGKMRCFFRVVFCFRNIYERRVDSELWFLGGLDFLLLVFSWFGVWYSEGKEENCLLFIVGGEFR